MPNENVLKRKICLVGDGAVGKTSLIRRFVLDEFEDRYITTIGTKVTKKSVKLESIETRIDMMLWDIMGQHGYSSLQRTYFSGAAGAIAVCDTTRRETLESIPMWVESLRGACAEIPVMVLANKADLKDSVQFTPQELQELSRSAGVDAAYYTSAKTGGNVEKSFLDMANLVLESAQG